MNIAFDGIHEVVATFLAEDGLVPGQVVKVTANGTVGPCSSGDGFCGQVLSLRQGAAAVQLGGFLQVSCANGCPSLGKAAVVSDGSGGIKTGNGGLVVQVVSVDNDSKTATIYL
jgi:hypothetical protein